MKSLAATLITLFTLASAFAQIDQTGTDASAPVRDAQTISVARAGARPSRGGPSENFTGSVSVDSLFRAGAPSRVSGGSVTFEPGARTDWHAHPLGQTLIVTAGVGRVQQWGGPAEEIRPGDVVRIPPGRKHWHGAAPTSAMTHISVVEGIDGKTTDWMEKVSDAQYNAPAPTQQSTPAARPAPPAGGRSTAGQKVMGDFAPKLAEITDEVLYDDVWARPGLSPRDRSLATVAALIAMNRPDQLRSHLTRARANGMTREEVVEVITHLAFYAGWPSAVTAIGVAREVFQEK